VATTLLTTGGYMLMPFGTAYAVGNLGLTLEQLPLIYLVTGLCSMIAGPLIGKIADQVGAFKVFVAGSILTTVMVLIYTNLGLTPLWLVIALNAVLFVGVTSRIISTSALTTAVPDPADRGAFMGINTSVAQVSGGIATAVAGMIVSQNENGYMEHYPTLGLVVAAAMVLVAVQFYFVNKAVHERRKKAEAINKEITK
jgi:predicted MFS family arabinose efflux permease